MQEYALAFWAVLGDVPIISYGSALGTILIPLRKYAQSAGADGGGAKRFGRRGLQLSSAQRWNLVAALLGLVNLGCLIVLDVVVGEPQGTYQGPEAVPFLALLVPLLFLGSVGSHLYALYRIPA